MMLAKLRWSVTTGPPRPSPAPPLLEFTTGRDRDPLREQALVVHDRLGPIGLTFVPGKHVGQLGMRPVHARPSRRLRLRRQHAHRDFLAGKLRTSGDDENSKSRGESMHI